MIAATVVVCQHDRATQDLICARLAEDGFEPLPAAGVQEALRLCRHRLPDLLVVDLDLPGDGGSELLHRIRQAHWLKARIDPYLPVLALRRPGAGAEEDELELLADDLLDKPFTYEDLRTQITAILRGRHGRLDRPVRVGDLLVDPGRRKVMVGEREVRLARKEFILLRVLASDPTRVFAREELLRDIWGLPGPATKRRTLDSHASRLRHKLDPDRRRFVVNCWGVGYKLLDSVDGDGASAGGGGERP